jgi:UDP-N-acetylglucosamine 2-epimerase (non-hydrolysing)
MKKISLIFGTRPEAIKLCPLVLALRDHSTLTPHVCVTGQHREMLDQVLQVFEVEPDVDLALMQPNQTLAGLTSRAIAAIDKYLDEHKPDMVIVQGDTTTVFCAALCAFYHKIPVGHVEAGLRTWNRHSPFPEEINRTLATRLADLHFAPTETSKQNLVREDVPEDRIIVTGNTVIDALLIASEKVKAARPEIPGLPTHLMNGDSPAPLVLITGHRRENFGAGFDNICQAIAELAEQFSDTHFVYPVHLNPNVRQPVHKALAAHSNIHLIEPLGYLPFVAMMARASLVLTDSGGVQEEAPSLGKPVLVMRDTTERPEAVEMGTVKLVGTDRKAIVENVGELLSDEKAHAAMANAVNPYGDGLACGRIVGACEGFLAGCEVGR